jgi:hypothetical protein
VIQEVKAMHLRIGTYIRKCLLGTLSNNTTPIKTAEELIPRTAGAFQVVQTTPGLLERILV